MSKDLADKYLIAGETQDIALMFVPAESVYADLQEHFDDVVQQAHRARVVIVSPSLLSLAIQVLQALVRDARIREEAQVIQIEVDEAARRRQPAARPRRQARHAFPPGAGRRRPDHAPRARRSPSAARRSRRWSSRKARPAPAPSCCACRAATCARWSSGASFLCHGRAVIPSVPGQRNSADPGAAIPIGSSTSHRDHRDKPSDDTASDGRRRHPPTL